MGNNITMKETAPIHRRKLYEEVLIRLEALIHEGEFKPGDPLPSEREMMAHFGVGRPAIREALFALQRMGLVVVANGERPRVSSPTTKTLLGELAGAARSMLAKPEGMQHFQQARALFECALAEEAARLATLDDMLRAGEGARREQGFDRRRLPGSCGPTSPFILPSRRSRAIRSMWPCTKRSWNGSSISAASRCAGRGTDRLAFAIASRHLRGDRSARSRGRRPGDASPSRGYRRALLEREGERGMTRTAAQRRFAESR